MKKKKKQSKLEKKREKRNKIRFDFKLSLSWYKTVRNWSNDRSFSPISLSWE
ncbi:hypothetical protein HanRHA438_Chr02g0080731 [Helianthus annuus]|nr:hypothetical protein HanRHA438_Chr02g0080731 [Helianthus annuus]